MCFVEHCFCPLLAAPKPRVHLSWYVCPNWTLEQKSTHILCVCVGVFFPSPDKKMQLGKNFENIELIAWELQYMCEQETFYTHMQLISQERQRCSSKIW